MKKIIIILIILNLALGVFITAKVIKEEDGITIYQIRDLIEEENLNCKKGCEFEITKVGDKYKIKSVKDKETKEKLYPK